MPTRRNTGWRERQAEMRAVARRMRNAAMDAEMGIASTPAPVSGLEGYTPPSWYREDVDYAAHATLSKSAHEVAQAIGLRAQLPNVCLIHYYGRFIPRGMRPYAHVYYNNRATDAVYGPTCSDQAVAVDYSTIEARVIANMAQDRVREFDVSTTEAIRNAAQRALGSSVSAARILADARAAPVRAPTPTMTLPEMSAENLRTALMGSAVPTPPDGTFKWSEKIRMTGLPEEGSRPWLRIAKIGCVGKRDSVGEFGCDFAWGCAKCPVTVAKEKAEAKDAPTKLDRFTLRKGRSNG